MPVAIVFVFIGEGGLDDNTCKRRGGSLGEGELDGTVVTCPLHAWTYDVTTGECFDDPACGVDRFPVKVEGDEILVEV